MGGGGIGVVGGGEGRVEGGGDGGLVMSMSLDGATQHVHDFPHPFPNFLMGIPPRSRHASWPSTHAASSMPNNCVPVSIEHVRGQKPGGNGFGGGDPEPPPPPPPDDPPPPPDDPPPVGGVKVPPPYPARFNARLSAGNTE